MTSANKQCCEKCLVVFDGGDGCKNANCPCHLLPTEKSAMLRQRNYDQQLIDEAYQQGQENMKAKAVGTIPNALRMVEESLRWGDSDYHSNSVRVGYNQAIEVIADRLNALPVSKEKEA